MRGLQHIQCGARDGSVFGLSNDREAENSLLIHCYSLFLKPESQNLGRIRDFRRDLEKFTVNFTVPLLFFPVCLPHSQASVRFNWPQAA
jgi:hypothetical protein